MAEAVSLLTCIRVVAGSNLVRATHYPERGVSWFSSVPLGKICNCLKLGHDRFLPHSLQFIIHCYPIIWRYTAWAPINKVQKNVLVYIHTYIVYVTPNDMTNAWNGRDLEESGRGLISGTTPVFIMASFYTIRFMALIHHTFSSRHVSAWWGHLQVRWGLYNLLFPSATLPHTGQLSHIGSAWYVWSLFALLFVKNIIYGLYKN
jgi:hypothetical protein